MDIVDILEALWRLVSSGYRRPGVALQRSAVLGLVAAGAVGGTTLLRGPTVDLPMLVAYAVAGLLALVIAVMLAGVLLALAAAVLRAAVTLVRTAPRRDP